MGLSIHYSGSFKKSASLPQMIEEVRDVIRVRNWEHFIFETDILPDEDPENTIYGICFTPPECETVFLSFLSDRKLISPPLIEFGDQHDGKKENFIFVKTQYAGPEIHKLIIDFLKYLSAKYFDDFMMVDEGKYWETGDEQILKAQFDRYNMLMDRVANALENFPRKESEDFEEYLRRILSQDPDAAQS